MKSFKWNLINQSNIEDKSGIYAWYYDLSLGKKDIENLIQSINDAACNVTKFEMVETFLKKRIFSFFQEQPYNARIEGKLMPSFQGVLEHVDICSSSLTEKIITNPIILYEVKKNIDLLSSEFMSPIYIGMSKNLFTRISKHKSLIESFKSEPRKIADFTDRDESFASRVVARGMIETKLRVSISYVESDFGIHNVMENLLNRINYPVLGRN